MRSEEMAAAGDLAAAGASGVARHVEEWHRNISGRVFSLLGTSAQPIRVVHDEISGLTYGAVANGLRGTIGAGGRAMAVMQAKENGSVQHSRRGRMVVGALNGVYGDFLEREDSALACGMSVVVAGRTVPIDPSSLSRAFPTATGQIAIFLHGLCETEDAWMWRRERGTPYASRLEAQTGFTPVFIRYNSGRHISANGRDFAKLLTSLVESWPVAVDEIALIGHSMGGLVARSACHYGSKLTGVARVRHVFSLGSPHHGAELERLAHAAGAALHRIPETRAISSALATRSVGIRDLYHGYLIDEDWENFEPNAFLVARAREIPFLATAHHYFVAATLTRDPSTAVARVFGDLLVSRPSAWSQREHERLRFPLENYRSVGGATHFDLLNHPAVADQLVGWLTATEAHQLAARVSEEDVD